MATSKSRRQPGENNQGAAPHGESGAVGRPGDDVPTVSNARLGLLLLPVSILIIVIGLVTGPAAVWVVGIVLAVADLGFCGNALLHARRSR